MVRDDAASSVFAVMMAAVVVVAAFGFVLFETQGATSGQERSVDAANLDSGAQTLATLLLSSAGHAPSVGNDWQDAPDDLSRLGLRLGGGHDLVLDYEKFDNLRLAPETDAVREQDPHAVGDGYVNYPEAKQSLGLSGVDFHIRAYPNLNAIEEMLQKGYKDPNMRVAYVGNWEARNEDAGPVAGLAVSNLACGPSPLDADVLRLTAEVSNGGEAPTQFLGVFDAVIDGKSERREDVTYLVPKDGSAVLRADFVGDNKWDCSKVGAVDVEVYGASLQQLGEFSFTGPGTQQSVSVKNPDLLARGSNLNPYVLDSEDAVVEFEGPGRNDAVTALVFDSSGTPVVDLGSLVSKDVGYEVRVAASSLAPGEYEMRLTYSGVTVAQRIYVVADGAPPADYAPPGGGSATTRWHESAGLETGFVAQIVRYFCPYEYDDAGASPMASPPGRDPGCTFRPGGSPPPGDSGDVGDVYPDIRRDLKKGLGPRLVNQGGPDDGLPNLNSTNLLVVGSGVDHQPMVHVKSEVAAWVEAGGTLIVFGSEDTNTQWMQSIFHLGIQSSSNGISVNDASHPILHVPDELDFQDYDNQEQAWLFTGGSEDLFTQIINAETQGGSTSTILSVSDAGVFGRGNVIVTSWFPHDIFNDGGSGDGRLEGQRFVNNLLSMSYRTLYLDYGPPIPEGAAVIGDSSKAAIIHPQLGRVTLDVVVYVFPGE